MSHQSLGNPIRQLTQLAFRTTGEDAGRLPGVLGLAGAGRPARSRTAHVNGFPRVSAFLRSANASEHSSLRVSLAAAVGQFFAFARSGRTASVRLMPLAALPGNSREPLAFASPAVAVGHA